MKRLFIICAMLLSFGAYSQNIQWGQEYEPGDKSSIYNYIGSIGEEHYFSYGYQTTGFIRRFNRIGFMSVNNNNVKSYAEQYVDIPFLSIISSFTTNSDIAVIYSQENKDKETNEVKCVLIDKTTYAEKSDNVLLSYSHSKKDDPKINIYSSNDKSKYVITYMNVNSKTKQGYFMVNVFDKDLNKLWSNKYSTEIEGSIKILNISPTNDGEVYILSELDSDNPKLILSKVNENEVTEKIVSDKLEFDDTKLHVINNNTVFIGDNSKGKFTGITFDFEKSEITNTVSFEYIKEKGTYWNLKDIYPLDNGNLVAIVEDAYLQIFEGSNSAATYTYYNRCFYALCVNPNEGNLVYNQLLSKATRTYNRYRIDKGQFESPLFFTKGNDFYAIYNADKGDNDLCGDVFIETNITFPKGGKDVVTNVLKISPQGTPTQKTLFAQKETKSIFSSNISFEEKIGEIIIGRFVDGDILNFGTMQLTE